VGYLEPELETLRKKVNFNIAKVKEKRKKRQELELCLAIQNASIGNEDKLRAKLELAEEQVRKLEREVTDLQSRPKGRYVESLKGEVTFEEEAKYWKKRWKQVEQACEIAGRVEASWRGVYEKEVEEVDRRMKKGKPRGKDKGVQVSIPQVAA